MATIKLTDENFSEIVLNLKVVSMSTLELELQVKRKLKNGY